MSNQINDLSLSGVARFAGIGYLIIFISGIFSNFYVLEGLVIPGDALATAANIIAGDTIFRIGIVGFFIMVIFDVLLAWALFILFEPVNRYLSLLSGWLRLVNGTIFGFALYNLLGVLNILVDDASSSAFSPEQVHAQIMLFINSFNDVWLIGLVFFGVHLFVLGYLIIKSGFIPKLIGFLLIAAAFGYMIDSFAHFLLANYSEYKEVFLLIVVVPGVIGEFAFTLWLLIKGSAFSKIKEVPL